MKEYPKIQSVYKRDEKTKRFIEGQWSLPEFEYLKDNIWQWTEKVDGTNIRVIWIPEGHDIPFSAYSETDSTPFLPYGVTFKGKTEKADIPKFLLAKLQEMFTAELFQFAFPETPLCLYGEGYGARIQKGGTYIPNGVSFALFDIRIGYWWLKREDIEHIGIHKLGLTVVPIIMEGTISEAIEVVRPGFLSNWSTSDRMFIAEGLVGKTKVEMRDRRGDRILTKLKTKDFLNLGG
jgi:hypothetical protein